MRGIRDVLVQYVTGGTDSKGKTYSAHNRSVTQNNGIPVPVGQIFDDLSAGNLTSFNALPMDPYGNPTAFPVVVALQYEGFRCVVDHLRVSGDGINNDSGAYKGQPVPAAAAKAAAALVSVAANVTDSLRALQPGDAREEYQAREKFPHLKL